MELAATLKKVRTFSPQASLAMVGPERRLLYASRTLKQTRSPASRSAPQTGYPAVRK